MPTAEQHLQAIRDHIDAYCRLTHDYSFKPDAPVVRLHEPTFGADETIAALDCLLSTRVTMGPKVKAFEHAFGARFGNPNTVVSNSGSSANLLAIAALANPLYGDALRPGDEVIVPALSWSTTVWPLVQHGLVPVVVDIDPETFNIDPLAAERAIGPRTRALMLVHVYGNPCAMDAITELCKRRNLMLIEDTCEAQGASFGGKPLGTFGIMGTFSFYFSHLMTTLEGGATVTPDFELAEIMRMLRAHGWVRELDNPDAFIARYPEIDKRFLFVNQGYNLRCTELQAAIGLIQLQKLDQFIEARRANYRYFRQTLGEYANVFDFQEETKGGYSTFFGFPVRLKPSAPFTRADLTSAMNRAGIETRPIICGNIARQPAMLLHAHRVPAPMPHADRVMDHCFSFALHQALDDGAREHVTNTIRSFLVERGVR